MTTIIRRFFLFTSALGVPAAGAAQADDFRLHQAALAGDTEAVSTLLDEGVSANRRDGNGRSALFFAAAAGHAEVAEQLLRYGVAIEAPDVERWTPLMAAASRGQTTVVEFLLAWGADPSAQSADGATARSVAEGQGHEETARVLDEALSPFRTMAPASVVPGRVYVDQEIDVRPSRAAGPSPRYPDELRRSGIEGGCMASFVITTDGTVDPDSYRTLSCTHPGFRQAVRQVIVRTRYRVGRLEDQPVPVRREQNISFNIQR